MDRLCSLLVCASAPSPQSQQTANLLPLSSIHSRHGMERVLQCVAAFPQHNVYKIQLRFLAYGISKKSRHVGGLHSLAPKIFLPGMTRYKFLCGCSFFFKSELLNYMETSLHNNLENGQTSSRQQHILH